MKKFFKDFLIKLFQLEKPEVIYKEKEPQILPNGEQDFDFSCLWREEQETGLSKYVPYVAVLLSVAILIILAVK